MKNTIAFGGFQNFLGQPLSFGYLTFQLDQDCLIISGGQVSSNIIETVSLDTSGNISGSPSLWPNDQLLPLNSQYIVKVYTQIGQLVYGPAFLEILSSPTPFNLSVWIP